jgi:predicted metal-dependent phosphoesterase TrpH
MGSVLSDTTYAVIYDLHSHTQASDGLLTPEALVHRAVEMRVGTLAITDHDTTDAIPAARAEIARCGLPLNLVAGVEISTLWENHEIHIVGLNIDTEHPAMCTFLQEQKARRNLRAEMIGERLEKAHIPGHWKGLRNWRTAVPLRAVILPVFWLRPVKPPPWPTCLKDTWRAGKPDTFRRSGVQ